MFGSENLIIKKHFEEKKNQSRMYACNFEPCANNSNPNRLYEKHTMSTNCQ